MSEEPRPNGSLASIGIVIGLSWGAFLAAIALFDGGKLRADWLETLPWVLLAFMPAFLALAGVLWRPGLLLSAGIVSIPLAGFSLAGAGLPLLIPGILYLVAFGRQTSTTSRVPLAVVVLLPIVLLIAAFMSFFLMDDPYCQERRIRADGTIEIREWTPKRRVQGQHSSGFVSSSGPTLERSCTGDRVVPLEVALGGSLTLGALALPGWLSRPKRQVA